MIIYETKTSNLAIARDWGQSTGFEGNYKLTLISDTVFTKGITSEDDAEVANYKRECL